MFEFLFLADDMVKPCEVVKFEYVSSREEEFRGGLIHHFYIKASEQSARFERDRIYVIRTTTFPNMELNIDFGFLAERATLVRMDAAAEIESGSFPERDIVEYILEAGVFFPNKFAALCKCEKVNVGG